MLRIKWFGHSMWKILNGNVSVLTDPFTYISYNQIELVENDFSFHETITLNYA